MSVVGIKLNGDAMCRNCGNCSKEHQVDIDDAIDVVLDSCVL
jgi:hypothetical protein